MKCTVLTIQVGLKIILQRFPTTIENGKYSTKLYVPVMISSYNPKNESTDLQNFLLLFQPEDFKNLRV
jgi:hypothetical protein